MDEEGLGVSGDDSVPKVIEKYLTDEQTQQFMEQGVLVVPNVLTPEEVAEARRGLHNELAKYGVVSELMEDNEDLEATGQNLKKMSSTGGAGGILDLFYPSWRLKVAEHDKVFAAMTDLWEATYAHNHPDFQHPFGNFDGKRGYMYINRVCYRVPDAISKKHAAKKSRPMQRSLTPHWDCCPTKMFDSGKDTPRWRPIQCITVLTDNTEANTGGFEAVPGFHREFAAYAAEHQPGAVMEEPLTAPVRRPQVCLGDFSPLRMQEDRAVIDRYQHIGCEAGSVIFFDWRTPHANSYKHVGTIPREVIYTGFIPDTPMNRTYVREQLRRYTARLLPADHWQKDQDARVSEEFSAHHFSALATDADLEKQPKHVVVGMSGGVDSSVAALLLKRQGYRVTGVYMKNWDPSDEEGESACPVDSEYIDVQKVCEQLDIEARMVNLVQSYWNSVFEPCLEGYEEGLTPNPDILCNREIKFKAFTEYAEQIGADYVATGHYAALRAADPEVDELPPNLCAAEDDTKDQSYFLSSVNGKAFANVLFPLGDMRKTEVRRIAENEGLCTATKKDSVGICFIGKRNFADFIHQYIPRQDGHFYSVDGEMMHEHHGFTAYTVGQGARLQGMSAKWFVVGKHKSDHSVIVAEGTRHPALFSDALFSSATQFNWMAGDLPQELRKTGRMRCFYRVRYRQDLDECTISLVSNREARESASTLHDWLPEPLVCDEEGNEHQKASYLRVDFDNPQRGVTPEQALVLYRGDGLCYGGGPIAVAGKTYFEQKKPLANNVHDWHRQG
ncbi:hypothetical protein BBJ29_005448 [Phytophthora kernoviae]|uniref:tRNA-5-taurinomethyluridine 2-sulfurtransferase n=1 Tax=Phytophthora kernoviae TaxID=325452 RepID=A0A3F2RMM7_9STRA|nr:hypothetical protein BBJ29_005448 [Phytophthora kernoviae]RLN60626.1 hypothetical protein BBP00_00005868 [Phytophthora kernoviae]